MKRYLKVLFVSIAVAVLIPLSGIMASGSTSTVSQDGLTFTLSALQQDDGYDVSVQMSNPDQVKLTSAAAYLELPDELVVSNDTMVMSLLPEGDADNTQALFSAYKAPTVEEVDEEPFVEELIVEEPIAEEPVLEEEAEEVQTVEADEDPYAQDNVNTGFDGTSFGLMVLVIATMILVIAVAYKKRNKQHTGMLLSIALALVLTQALPFDVHAEGEVAEKSVRLATEIEIDGEIKEIAATVNYAIDEEAMQAEAMQAEAELAKQEDAQVDKAPQEVESSEEKAEEKAIDDAIEAEAPQAEEKKSETETTEESSTLEEVVAEAPAEQAPDTYLTGSIQVDGKEISYRTNGADVLSILEAADITLGENDTVSPKPDTVITEDGTPIKVVRITFKDVVEKETVKFSSKKENDSSLEKGKTKVATKGVNGSKDVTYTIKYEDGKEVSKEKVSEKVTKKAVTEVIKVGTKPPIERNADGARIVRSTGGLKWVWPLDADSPGAFTITSLMGTRESPGGIGSTNHQGTDIAANSNTKILAVAAGTVIQSGWNGGYGISVTIRTDSGYTVLYGHMSQAKVNYGARVTAGQTVGLEGSTGNSTGPHLHFEVRNGAGTAINGLSLYGKDIYDQLKYWLD